MLGIEPGAAVCGPLLIAGFATASELLEVTTTLKTDRLQLTTTDLYLYPSLTSKALRVFTSAILAFSPLLLAWMNKPICV